jgi:hypothetical protein
MENRETADVKREKGRPILELALVGKVNRETADGKRFLFEAQDCFLLCKQANANSY